MRLGYQIPEQWIVTTLGSALIRSDERIDPLTSSLIDFSYIGLENIESNTGRLLPTSSVSNEEVRSMKNIFHKGDILYGKLRPYLNKVFIAEKNGICSTDIWVFRPAPFIDPEYAAYYLRSPYVLQRVSQFATGANLPRVSATAFDAIPVPLPLRISEQRRIVSLLHEADRLRQLRREADEKLQQLLPTLFYEMFGDPVTNPKGWHRMSVENVSLRITDGTHQPPPFTENGIPFIFVSNIVDGEINLNTTKYISRETYNALMKRCPIEQDDILYSTVGSYGVAVIVETDEPFAFQRHIAHIKLDRTIINPLFLRSMLNSSYVKAQVDQRVRGIAQATLNLGEIAKLRIFVPPLVLQQDFADKTETVRAMITKATTINQQLNTLFQSFLVQAFTGELTAAWREEHKGLETISTYDFSSIEHLEIQDELRVVSEVDIEKGLHPFERVEAKILSNRRVYADLSDEQRTICDLVNNMKGYCTVETLKANSDLPLYVIRQGLQLLTQIGLIQAVCLPHRPIRSVVYVPAYRTLDESDLARIPDIDMLQQILQREIML